MSSLPSARRYRALGFGGALAALALASGGCGGPSFERAPRTPADISGHWVYVAEASDDADKLIRAALPAPRRPQRPDRDPTAYPLEDGTGGRGGGRAGGQRRGGQGGDSAASSNPNANNPPVWGRGSALEYVRAFAFPAQRLDFTTEPDRITLTQAGRRRTFQPGDEEPFSVNDRYGSRTVRAGWDGAVFNIKSSSSTRLGILERFRQLSGDRLATDVEFSTPGMHTVKIHSVYRRATASELEAAPPDGPPVPGPR